MRYPSFVGPSYTSQSKIADGERCVNWYPEKIEASGKAQWALYPCPGFTTWATLAEGPVRGFFTQNGRTFAVGGTRLYELSATGVATERGTGLSFPDGAPASIASNGDGGHQLFITSGSKGYVYDLLTNTLTFAIDGATQCGFIDGFFLALDPQTSTFKISNLEDGTTWQALQVAQRNAGADRWGAMLVAHKEIWLFGSQTTEVWYNAGTAPFPFAPNPNVFLNTGILAPSSAAMVDNAPTWLGQNTDGGGMVYRANGYTPQRISTHALEYALSTYSTLLDAVAWSYQEQGHSFYVLSFPTAGATWVYDAATGAWHERGGWNGTVFTGSPVYGHTFAYGLHLVGSTTTGAVYSQAVSTATTVGGATMRRLRRAPHVNAEADRLFFTRFQLDLETGLGLATGQGSDPTVMLRTSDDGGQTWSSERWKSAGALGAYKARTMWFRLGSARDRVFEVAVSDPIPWRIVDAYLDVTPGQS